MAEAFLFDIGNVIVTFDFMKAARRVEALSALPAAEIFERLVPLMVPLETGHISSDTFIAEAGESIGYSGSPEFFKEAFGNIFELNAPIASLIESLKAEGMPLYLLSNTNGIHIDYLTSQFPIFRLFDAAIYSHEVGMMKPDLAIFERVKETLPIRAERTIYLDDLPDNCEAAKVAGFLAVNYRVARHTEAIREIEALRSREK